MKRYFEILGVGRDTPLDEVRQAYHDLVRVWHPDRFSSDYRLSRISEEKLKLINEAYREVRAHIEKSPPPEQGVLFTKRPPANTAASADDSEYMFDFYDPDYSPWIWTYQRERGSGRAATQARSRWPRLPFLIAGICALGLSGVAVAWHYGLIPEAAVSSLFDPPPLPTKGETPVLPVPEEATLRPEASPLGPGIREGRSLVRMENDTGDDAVVKLVLLEPGGVRMVRSVFLPAGKTFTATEAPPGRYLVKVALGAGWDIRAMRFRRPAGFAVSSAMDLEEEATDNSSADGIAVRRFVASELRVPLNRALGTRITEAEFLAD